MATEVRMPRDNLRTIVLVDYAIQFGHDIAIGKEAEMGSFGAV